jgi:hypothetical protein
VSTQAPRISESYKQIVPLPAQASVESLHRSVTDGQACRKQSQPRKVAGAKIGAKATDDLETIRLQTQVSCPQ